MKDPADHFTVEVKWSGVTFAIIYFNTAHAIQDVTERVNFASEKIRVLQHDLDLEKDQVKALHQKALIAQKMLMQVNDTLWNVITAVNNINVQKLEAQMENATLLYHHFEEVTTATVQSLTKLNSTLWQMATDIAVNVDNMQRNLTEFETRINSKVQAVVCLVRANTSQNILGDNNKLQYGIIDTDSHNGWDAANSQYIIPLSGFYSITGQMYYAPTSATVNFQLNCFKNNNQLVLGGANSRSSSSQTYSTVALPGGTVHLNAGDSVALFASQGSGVQLQTHVNPSFLNLNWFSIARV